MTELWPSGSESPPAVFRATVAGGERGERGTEKKDSDRKGEIKDREKEGKQVKGGEQPGEIN